MESGELIARFLATMVELDKLQGVLFEHARQQERLELRFNELEQVTRDLVSFMQVTPGQITEEWIAQRNRLVMRVQPFLIGGKSKGIKGCPNTSGGVDQEV